MRNRIQAALAAVRRRQRLVLTLKAVAAGLLISSLATIVATGINWSRLGDVSIQVLIGLLATGPALGLVAGLLYPASWNRAAAAVDASYGLKDRSATALAFADNPQRSILQDLQVEDAAKHLERIDPAKVVPITLTRMGPCAIGTLAVTMGIMALTFLLPVSGSTADASPVEANPFFVAEAKKLLENLREFEDAARQGEDKELEQLLQQLQQKAEEMQQPGVDLKEALAKLSEMQAAIAAHQAQYNTGIVDGQLQALGDALSAAAPLEGAGKALHEGKYDRAAEELEKIQDPEFDRKEARAVDEKLKEVAKAAGEVGLGELCEAAGDIAEGVRGNKAKFQKGTKVVAKIAKNQARRKKINDLLDAQLARLSDCKCDCEANGGPEGKRPVKSTTPSNSWGRSTSGNVQGEKTSLLSQRRPEQVTGTAGEEGDSESETTHSVEGRQQAGRKYQDVYKDYKRMSEAVLDSEPIPLGHRQTIRKYFELIRPQNTDVDKERKD